MNSKDGRSRQMLKPLLLVSRHWTSQLSNIRERTRSTQHKKLALKCAQSKRRKFHGAKTIGAGTTLKKAAPFFGILMVFWRGDLKCPDAGGHGGQEQE